MSQQDINVFNAEVTGWSAETFGDEKSRYIALINSPKRTGDGLDSLRIALGKKFGEIDTISFKFNRYLVFVHKGVGKGRPIGSAKAAENAKPWLNPVLDQQVPKLAAIVARLKGDQAVKALDIK